MTVKYFFAFALFSKHMVLSPRARSGITNHAVGVNSVDGTRYLLQEPVHGGRFRRAATTPSRGSGRRYLRRGFRSALA